MIKLSFIQWIPWERVACFMHTVAKQQFHIKSISSCDKVSDAENLLLCVTCTKGQQLYKHYPKKYLNQCGIQKLVYKTQFSRSFFQIYCMKGVIKNRILMYF